MERDAHSVNDYRQLAGKMHELQLVLRYDTIGYAGLANPRRLLAAWDQVMVKVGAAAELRKQYEERTQRLREELDAMLRAGGAVHR